jgi:hypothetical protein
MCEQCVAARQQGIDSSPDGLPSGGEYDVVNSATSGGAQELPPPLPWEPASSDPSNGAIDTRPPRQRVRHSFDIFSDQLLSLRDIALRRELRQSGRVRLGDLVQEALDAFIAHETGQSSVHGASNTPGVSLTGDLGAR